MTAKSLFTGLLASLSCLALPACADPSGLWKTQAENGEYAIVKIAPCGAALCGTVMESYGKDGAPTPDMHGKTVMSEMVPASAGYTGKLWHPRLKIAFKGTMREDGGALILTGCAFGGALCREQVWTRIK